MTLLILLGCGEAPKANSQKTEPTAKTVDVEQSSNPKRIASLEEDLQGTWKVVEATSQGKKEENAIGVEYTFSSGKLLIRRPNRETPQEHEYEIDHTQRPPHLDLLLTFFVPKRRMQGIFRLEEDQLIWCSSVSAFPRPTAFEADQEGESVYIFQRVEE